MGKNETKILRINAPSWVECRLWLQPTQLVAALNAEAIGSAIILHGREGIGKRQLVGMALARLFCVSSDACGNCAPCLQILNGNHPEILWCEGDDQLKVEVVEKIQEHLAYQAYSLPGGRRFPRVAVVIGAERLNLTSANRLLKILEEPPAGALVIFTTSQLGRLPPTLRSRLLRWRVGPPDQSRSILWLKDQLHRSDIVSSDGEIAQSLVRSQFAPIQCLEYLVRTSRGEAEVDMRRFLSCENLQETLLTAELWARQDKRPIARWVTEVELALNHCYRHKMQSDEPARHAAAEAARRRRQILREVKRTAVQGKIAINAQLFLESIGVAGIKPGL